jgi:carboxypeptidase D
VRDVANAIKYSGHAAFVAHALEPYKVKGVEKGSFKTQGNLSFLRAYEAGHMVMYYRKFTVSCFTRQD